MCGDQCFSINFGNVSHDTTGKLLNGRPESIMFKLCSVQEFLYTYVIQIRYALLEYFYLDCSIREIILFNV